MDGGAAERFWRIGIGDDVGKSGTRGAYASLPALTFRLAEPACPP